MREILFRGKRIDNGEWIYGWLVSQHKKCTDGDLLTEIQSNTFGEGRHSVDTETVGQYTGLRYKDGTRIFEGDIVKVFDAMVGEVKFCCGAFVIVFEKTIDWEFFQDEIPKYTGCDNLACVCFNDNVISLWEIYTNFNEEDASLGVIEKGSAE